MNKNERIDYCCHNKNMNNKMSERERAKKEKPNENVLS